MGCGVCHVLALAAEKSKKLMPSWAFKDLGSWGPTHAIPAFAYISLITGSSPLLLEPT